MSNSDLFKGYLSQPTDRDFRFASVSEEDVIKIIHNLKAKSSCGCDEISVKLIKFAKNELCKPIYTTVGDACVCVCVCVCVQNWTNFCPYALILTPNVP